MVSTIPSLAGGYLTNTNQSVAFLRNPARIGAIGIDGAYSNPAGIGFLGKGWHLSFNIQSAYQTRDIYSTFGTSLKPFALGEGNNPNGEKLFEGRAKAPFFPTFDIAKVYDKWFFSAHLGITGGGGKGKFTHGLGSFESQAAMLPLLINAIAPGSVKGYAVDAYMHGRQYYWGAQLNAGYKLTDELSVSGGFRFIYADCQYYGRVDNMSVITAGGQKVLAGDLLRKVGMTNLARLTDNRSLNCSTSGFGLTPIIGVDWKFGKWNLAARYEFKTRLRLKNETGVNSSGLEEFDDGRIIPADIPAILALGGQYEVLPTLRLNAGMHYYFDKQATQYKHREKHLAGGGWEVLAGVEWDVNDRLTLSLGGQSTNYGLGKNSKFISDMSFVTNSTSVGLGAKVKIRKNMALNVAYFKTFYQSYTKSMDDYNGLKANFASVIGKMAQSGQLTAAELAAVQNISTSLQNFNSSGRDRFKRTNDVIGVGLELDF